MQSLGYVRFRGVQLLQFNADSTAADIARAGDVPNASQAETFEEPIVDHPLWAQSATAAAIGKDIQVRFE